MTKSRRDDRKSGKHPLKGFRVLVGRARHQAGGLSTDLRKLGAEVIEIPFIEIRKPRSFRLLDTALKNLSTYDWLVLTSVNGVEALFARTKKLRIQPAKLKHLQVAAIGPATQREIEEHGLKVAVTPEKYVAESVVDALKGKTEGKRVLLVRAKVARDEHKAAGREASPFVLTVFAGLDERWLAPDSRPRQSLERVGVERLILLTEPPFDPQEIQACGRLLAPRPG